MGAHFPQDSQALTRVLKLRREDLRRRARLDSMLRLAVTLVFVVAMAGALADLARGRRPLLFGWRLETAAEAAVPHGPGHLALLAGALGIHLGSAELLRGPHAVLLLLAQLGLWSPRALPEPQVHGHRIAPPLIRASCVEMPLRPAETLPRDDRRRPGYVTERRSRAAWAIRFSISTCSTGSAGSRPRISTLTTKSWRLTFRLL